MHCVSLRDVIIARKACVCGWAGGHLLELSADQGKSFHRAPLCSDVGRCSILRCWLKANRISSEGNLSSMPVTKLRDETCLNLTILLSAIYSEESTRLPILRRLQRKEVIFITCLINL